MKIVCVSSGLANQMFMYAYSRYLVSKGENVYIALQARKPFEEFAFEKITIRDVFPNVKIREMRPWMRPLVQLFFKNGYSAQRLRRILSLFGIRYYHAKNFSYEPWMMEPQKSWCGIYRGLWQSENYFKECANDVRKQFAFPEFTEDKNIAIAAKMAKENSVAIHLRKGVDYMRSESFGKNLCEVGYYLRAINYIKKHVHNPVFYVFTDNPQWVKENLPSFDYSLVDWNEVAGKTQFRDMQLMSCCKHNIIANSTYSWWGAWLNSNPDKIVIAPNKWCNPVEEKLIENCVVPDKWIRL